MLTKLYCFPSQTVLHDILITSQKWILSSDLSKYNSNHNLQRLPTIKIKSKLLKKTYCALFLAYNSAWTLTIFTYTINVNTFKTLFSVLEFMMFLKINMSVHNQVPKISFPIFPSFKTDHKGCLL